jgi:hypothetical protein
MVQITRKRRDASPAQSSHARGLRSERAHRELVRQQARHAKTNVSASDDENAAAAKARGQSA